MTPNQPQNAIDLLDADHRAVSVRKKELQAVPEALREDALVSVSA